MTHLLIVDIFPRNEDNMDLYFAGQGDRFWELLTNTGLFDVEGPLSNDSVAELHEMGVEFCFFYGDDEFYPGGIREVPYQRRREATEEMLERIQELQPRVVLLVGSHMAQLLLGRGNTEPGERGRRGNTIFYVVSNTRQMAFRRNGDDRLQDEFDDFAHYYENLPF